MKIDAGDVGVGSDALKGQLVTDLFRDIREHKTDTYIYAKVFNIDDHLYVQS